MAEWRVQLIGEGIDLKVLHQAFNNGDLFIIQDNGEFFLRAKEFDTLNDPDKIKDRAVEFVRIMNDAAYLSNRDLRPVSVGSIVHIDDDGKRQFFVEAHLHAYARAVATASITGPDNQPIQQKHPITSIYEAAIINRDIVDALHFFGQKDWINLYKGYEIVRDNVGGDDKLRKLFKITKSQLSRFTVTAQSRDSIGDDARHAAKKFKPHPNPMSIHEASAFIGDLIQKWIQWKSP